jgi:hypothetical protein
LVRSLVEYVNSHHDCYDMWQAEDILNVLRRRRMFEEMRRAADAFLNNDCLTFKIRKYYAQAVDCSSFTETALKTRWRLKNEHAR